MMLQGHVLAMLNKIQRCTKGSAFNHAKSHHARQMHFRIKLPIRSPGFDSIPQQS